jgi:superfamily II DNA or RNA helicase
MASVGSACRGFRAPAYRFRSLLAALTEHRYRVDNAVSRETLDCAPWCPIELRPYQQAALSTWRKQACGLIVMPTGSGKTRLACAVMAACAAPALCLVPTRALLHQFREEIAKYYSGSLGMLGDGSRILEAVTVATFESAYRNMPRVGNRFELLVVDEVHHFGVGVRDEAQMCTAPRRLALTATAPEGRACTRTRIDRTFGLFAQRSRPVRVVAGRLRECGAVAAVQ